MVFMDFRQLVSKEIARQEGRIAKLEHELETAKTYLKAQVDMLKLLPSDGNAAGTVDDDVALRPGGDPAKVRDILKAAGAPLHVMELLARLGKALTPENRATLTGTLGNYVRKNRVFVKTAPNTFGLLNASLEEADEIPESFGTPEADKPSPAKAEQVQPSSDELEEDVPF